ncbi:hypothetical protein Fcan01_16188 [Folsomia candida]|uniref:Uncharacterized protein n=1 Tax=Folsomia candida TaxID=158441 RepID=A0A226DUN7_FOLCA|nr:hypothetical protein Fcan01_16188 [Folsomia candida]
MGNLTWPRPNRENSRPRPLNFDLVLTSKILRLSEVGLGLFNFQRASARSASASPIKTMVGLGLSNFQNICLRPHWPRPRRKVPGLGLIISASASRLEPQASARSASASLIFKE